MPRSLHWAQRRATPAPEVRSAPRPRFRSYAGAQGDRLMGDFDLASINAPDAEIGSNLRTLRARSRDLCRNSALAARYLQIVEDNVVGPDGILLQVKAETTKGVPYTAACEAIEAAWAEWSEPSTCTVDGRLDLVGFAKWCERTRAMDGEAFIQKTAIPGSPFRFALNWIDPDRVDYDYTTALADGGFIRQGVECDATGRPVAYHIWTAHPADYLRPRIRERIPADQIIHYYRPLRAGQTRGVPDFTPVLRTMKILDGYIEAELVAARVASSKMGFITNSEDSPSEITADQIPLEAEAGLLGQLAVGQDFKPWDPAHPMTAFPDFTSALLHWICGGLGVSYMTLAGDLSQTSFSSGRIGLLAERDRWRSLQREIQKHVLTPIYRSWLPFALLSGRLEALAGQPITRWHAVKWQGRGFPWVDPVKEIESAKAEVAMGVNTLERIAAERGLDLEEVLAQRQREIALAAQLKVPIELGMAPGTVQDPTDILSEVPHAAKPRRLAAVASGR